MLSGCLTIILQMQGKAGNKIGDSGTTIKCIAGFDFTGTHMGHHGNRCVYHIPYS